MDSGAHDKLETKPTNPSAYEYRTFKNEYPGLIIRGAEMETILVLQTG